MVDYSKSTVVELRAEFKTRGIPATGLTRKQQLIDRLIEDDQTKEKPSDAPQAASTTSTEQYTAVEPLSSPRNDANGVESLSALPAIPSEASTIAIDVGGGAQTERGDSSGDPPSGIEIESVVPAQEDVGMDLEQEYVLPEHASSVSVDKANDELKAVENTSEISDEVDKGAKQDASPRQSPQAPLLSEEAPVKSEPAIPQSSTPIALRSPERALSAETSLKRKRRSVTPPIASQDTAQKRSKQPEVGVVHLKEDPDHKDVPLETQIAGHATGPSNSASHSIPAESTAPSTQAASSHPVAPKRELAIASRITADTNLSQEQSSEPYIADANTEGAARGSETVGSLPDSTKPSAGRDQRYRELYTGLDQNVDGVNDQVYVDQSDRIVAPALHPATRALYIRNFMRPLLPNTLREHLTSLAQAPSTLHNSNGTKDSSTTVLLEFYLDSVKTHCFTVFETVAAAARVRSALHDIVWPTERDRKPLWADFIPEEKVQEWIDTETNVGGRARGAGAKRWEVVYEHSPQDHSVTALLQDATGLPPKQSQIEGVTPAAHFPPPEVHRESPVAMGRDNAIVQNPKDQITSPQVPLTSAPQPASFLALDSLFRSTVAKPKLYYLPISKERADARLDVLDAKTSKIGTETLRTDHRSGRAADEMKRYTFENGDTLVDNGPEFGLRRGALRAAGYVDGGDGGPPHRYGRREPGERGGGRGNYAGYGGRGGYTDFGRERWRGSR